ncbi:hypothetical protein, partial [Enterococcus faecium]|uniref:hypothetical protein n=1 Tax=Enterococcus faecium TaxID=1352 RepID=UPI003AADE42E
ERWIKYRDSEGRERNKLEKFVLGRHGVDTPDWVADLVRQGLTKRNENWHRVPDGMLASKVVRRLVKRFAAHIALGVDAFDSLRISSPAVTPQADPPQPTAAGEAPVSYTIPSDDAFERLPLDGI